MKKGFIFSFEAILSLLLLLLMICFLPAQPNLSLKELACIQQANDLLRIWSLEETSESEMISDTKLVFENNAQVMMDEKIIYDNPKKNNSISTQGEILDEGLSARMVKITVFFD